MTNREQIKQELKQERKDAIQRDRRYYGRRRYKELFPTGPDSDYPKGGTRKELAAYWEQKVDERITHQRTVKRLSHKYKAMTNEQLVSIDELPLTDAVAEAYRHELFQRYQQADRLEQFVAAINAYQGSTHMMYVN